MNNSKYKTRGIMSKIIEMVVEKYAWVDLLLEERYGTNDDLQDSKLLQRKYKFQQEKKKLSDKLLHIHLVPLIHKKYDIKTSSLDDDDAKISEIDLGSDSENELNFDDELENNHNHNHNNDYFVNRFGGNNGNWC